MKKNQTGQTAKEIVLNSVEGQPFILTDELKNGKNVLLVFLRHLG